jgi:hypothetical protein
MTRSYKPARIERLGGEPPKRTGTNQAKKVRRCPIMGQPVEWLEIYNEKIRREEAYKLKYES